MPDIAPQVQREEFWSLLAELREDFAAIRRQCAPIRVRLVHQGQNARFQGVERFPFEDGPRPVFHGSAGSREMRQRFDANGHPLFTDKPALDAAGVPITNSAGEAFAFTPGAHRFLDLFGGLDAVARLQASATRGGQLVAALRPRVCALLRGWQFSRDDESLWWALLFEVAWSERHPLLRAKRLLWRCTPNAHAYFPYDRDQLRRLHDFPGGENMGIPSAWLDELPDAYKSELGDAASASADLAGLLLSGVRDARDTSELAELWNDLSDRQRFCLIAMYQLHTLDADSRRRADEIASRAEGKEDAAQFKVPLSDLVKKTLIESKIGRDGGYWFSSAGRELVEFGIGTQGNS